jgi:hypothetical protein
VSTTYNFEQIATAFVTKATNYVAWRYRHYGVERDDVQQELYVWLYGTGRPKVERWLESNPQQTTRIYRSLLDAGMGYAEGEKAAKVGYKVDDVYWFSPSQVTGLMPLVLDSTFVQENGHVGELITMVIDIRRVIGTGELYDYFMQHSETDPAWDDNVQTVIDKLGGDRPFVGRRKAMSNAKATAITSQEVA